MRATCLGMAFHGGPILMEFFHDSTRITIGARRPHQHCSDVDQWTIVRGLLVYTIEIVSRGGPHGMSFLGRQHIAGFWGRRCPSRLTDPLLARQMGGIHLVFFFARHHGPGQYTNKC